MSAVVLSLAMTVAMAVSGLVAWRVAVRKKRGEGLPAWRDDSLDEWRREQADSQARERRERDATKTPLRESSRQIQESEVEERRQTRIGG